MANSAQNEFNSISKEEMAECKRVCAEEGARGLESYLKRKNEEWKLVPLNIGIIGNSGSGKSSFINGIRNMLADDEGAAKVGVTEQTTIPTAYEHPNNPNMKFWDLPGVGTPKFPKEKYLKEIGFENFDFFIIITHTRFTENDLWICQEIKKKGKRFFFVRSKVHQDIQNDKEANPKSHRGNPGKVDELLEKMRSNIKESLGDLYVPDSVFLVDSYKRSKYQFSELEEQLIHQFPVMKREALLLSLGVITKNTVRMKAEVLRSEIWKSALLSAGAAFIPIPGLSICVDLTIIVSRSLFYFQQLGLDEESLQKTAWLNGSDVKELKAIVNKDFNPTTFFTAQGVKELLVTMPALALAEGAEEISRWIPFIGSFIAAPISAMSTRYVLTHILDQMEKTAILVLDTAIQL